MFNFTAISSYNDIQLEPELILYPDVRPGSEFYEDINLATMLSLVNGYLNEKGTPFHPDLPVTRIQALKIILSATDLVPYLHQFELANLLGAEENISKQKSVFSDVSAKISSRWWYPRYVNFALENDIIDKGELFRPDENITIEELDDMVNRTLQYLKRSSN